MKRGKPQAKDLPDDTILSAMAECGQDRSGYSMLWDLEMMLSQYPPKVVLAKLRSLIKRKIIDGCGCGCGGNFTIIKEKETVQ